LGLVIGLVVLAFMGAIYQAFGTEIYRRLYPPPGELVDVDGHSLHINCVGEGSPTVILESGLGAMPVDWANIHGEQELIWLELQDELAALSSNSVHRVVEGATHASLLDDQRDAQVTSMAILEVVEAVRNGQPLMQ
jgi:hypothetical protein